MSAAPLVSVLIPAYHSQETLGGCLEALARQTFRDFEVVVVDSGTDPVTEPLVRERFPWVRFERSPRRLLPHAARNRGVVLSRGELLVFTDPDIYARPDWLEELLAVYRAAPERGAVVGALACHGRKWRDRAIHLCKFSKWLPAGEPRPVDMGPTANLLVSRQDFEAAGGLPDALFLGDVTLSWGLRRRGRAITFAPAAVVAHHHTQSLSEFLEERYSRGKLYGDLQAARLAERRRSLLLHLGATLLPVRLARNLALVAGHAARAGELGTLLSSFPVVVLGHAASLAGEAVCYLQMLAGMGRPAAVTEG